MPCNCSTSSSSSESCPSCDCSISLTSQSCDTDNKCVIKVADHVQKTVVGNVKLYVITLLVKNCTKKTLTNFHISLDLKCALIDFPLIQACDSPITDTPAVGILTLDTTNCHNLLQSLCIEAAPYLVNAGYNGVDSTSLLDHAANGNVRLPPGETCITVRFFTPATASLISPCVTLSVCVPCCGPIRKVVMLKADCAPTILDRTSACFVDCQLAPVV